ncbi:MAG: hypothetical protein VW934_05190 [Alphaproteobacteria bacterium]
MIVQPKTVVNLPFLSIRLLVQPNRYNESFLFTNWTGGKEYSAERPEEYSCDAQSLSIPVRKC